MRRMRDARALLSVTIIVKTCEFSRKLRVVVAPDQRIVVCDGSNVETLKAA